MIRFILRRLAQAVPTLLAVVTVSLEAILIVNGRCEGALQELPAGGQVPPLQPESRNSTQNP